jgi:predicted nucleic acid-binding protein
VFQEILYRYFHIRQMGLGRQLFAHFKLVVDSILPVLPEDIFLVEELARQYPETKPRDLLHAAVMQNNGIDKILSVDRDFDGIDGIERIDPLEFD